MKTTLHSLMRYLVAAIALLLINIAGSGDLSAQSEYDTSKTYQVIKNDGNDYIGKILKSDEREILLQTTTVGRIYIPKHEIRSIKEVNPAEVGKGGYLGEEPFATRHYFTPNGLPRGKGNHYAILNLWGPDVEFALGEKFSMGLMTTWIPLPLIANAKYSIKFAPKVHLGLGAMAGTLSWATFKRNGVLPYGSLTFGDRKNNLSFTGGYLSVNNDGNTGSQAMYSVGAMKRLSKGLSFIFDSFIIPGNEQDVFETSALIIPGLRFNGNNQNRSFQFGIAGIVANGKLVPVPIPFVSWLRAF